MFRIPVFEAYHGEKHAALLDCTAISFLNLLDDKDIAAQMLLDDYDLILISGWVYEEVQDSPYRCAYIQKLLDEHYPIFVIPEVKYAAFVNGQEYDLFKIVEAAVNRLAQLKGYLHRFVAKEDPLDMDLYQNWICELYERWPFPNETLRSGRIKKKNAGEISITILAEILSLFLPDMSTLTMYSQDSDTYAFQKRAEEILQKEFPSRLKVPVTYKTNDAILCQLYRTSKIGAEKISDLRKDQRKVIFTRKQTDHSIVCCTEILDNVAFLDLIRDETAQIIF